MSTKAKAARTRKVDPAVQTFYDVLGVDTSADGPSIKRAYLRAARDTHPDRFQEVGRAYAVLSDPEKRSLYDETGMVDDRGGDGASFWREAFERISLEKIDELAASYRHSAEEASDLRKLYADARGELGKIIDGMMFSTAEDEPRFREQLRALVDAGELPAFRAFAAESDSKRRARERRAAKEAAEAEVAAEELGLRRGGGGGDGLDALKSALALRDASRKSQFGSMLDSLEERFGSPAGIGKAPKAKSKKPKAKGAARGDDPLGNEAFAATQAQMLDRGKAKKPKARGAASGEDPLGDEAFAATQAQMLDRGKAGRR